MGISVASLALIGSPMMVSVLAMVCMPSTNWRTTSEISAGMMEPPRAALVENDHRLSVQETEQIEGERQRYGAHREGGLGIGEIGVGGPFDRVIDARHGRERAREHGERRGGAAGED